MMPEYLAHWTHECMFSWATPTAQMDHAGAPVVLAVNAADANAGLNIRGKQHPDWRCIAPPSLIGLPHRGNRPSPLLLLLGWRSLGYLWRDHSLRSTGTQSATADAAAAGAAGEAQWAPPFEQLLLASAFAKLLLRGGLSSHSCFGCCGCFCCCCCRCTSVE